MLSDKLYRAEEKLAELIGSRYAVITGSGRSALRIALQSLDIKEGEIVMPNLTCPIVAQTFISQGITPVPVDINPDLSSNIEGIRKSIGKSTRAIVLVHLYGCPTDDVALVLDLAKRYHMYVIEDVAQSFGAKIKGRYAGSFGDIGVFSFSKKFFGLFRGGAIVTNSELIAEKARRARHLLQTPPDRIALALKGLMRRSPIKRVPFRQVRNTASADYLDRSYSYHFQHLMEAELQKVLATLQNIEQLELKERTIVRELTSAIAGGKQAVQLHEYNPEFVYTRFPALVRGGSLQEFISYLEKKGIHIDCIYPALSRHRHLAIKCRLGNSYPVSEETSSRLLPLPLDRRLINILSDNP